MMKMLGKTALTIFVISLVLTGLCSGGWAQSMQVGDQTNDFMTLMDVFIARPAGIVATAFGTGVWIVSLPFSIPTGNVVTAAETFMHEPFIFTFYREFPDYSR